MSFTDPVLGEDFFDRVEIISKLKKKIDSLNYGFRQNIALLGQLLSGKTSILKHFLTNFEDNRFLFFYLEVKGNSFTEFITRFLSSFLSSLLSKEDEFNKIYLMDNQTLLNKFKSYLPRTSCIVNELFGSLEISNFDKAYGKLFDILETAKSELNKPLVVILEEFQRLSDFPIKSPFEIFGKKLSLQKDIMYIISSSFVKEAKKIISEELSLLFCNFEIIEVLPFDYLTSKNFIDKRCKEINLEACYRNFVISITDGRPFYLNTICSKLMELSYIYGSSISQRDLIIKTLEELVFKSNGVLNQYLSNMFSNLESEKKFNLCFQILLHLSNDSKATNLSTLMKKNEVELSKLLKVLVQKDFLSKFGIFYRFNHRLLKLWINSVYVVKESPYKNFYVDGKDFFSFRNLKILESFIHENEKNTLDRVVELFKSFNGEMIELSSQRFILPHFDIIYSSSMDEKGYKIIGNSKNKGWLFFISDDELPEEKLTQWVFKEKGTFKDFKKRVLITLHEPEVATKLLAKQEKILTWSIFDLNILFELYGKPQLIKI